MEAIVFIILQIFFATHTALKIGQYFRYSVVDPDLELRGGGGGAVLIFLPCWPFSLQSFLAPPLDPPLVFPSFSWGIFGYVMSLDQLRTSGNI